MNRTISHVRTCRAFILTETCVSLALMGMVLAAVSLLIVRHAAATDYLVNYRRAQLAAESTANILRCGALEAVDADFMNSEEIRITVQRTMGDPAWEPLQCVRITATVTGRHRQVARYSIQTYVMPKSGNQR